MEFKKRLRQRKATRKAKANQAKGKVRTKVRGRKRWRKQIPRRLEKAHVGARQKDDLPCRSPVFAGGAALESLVGSRN